MKDLKPKLIKDLGMKYATEKSNKKYRYGIYECPYCGKEWETLTYGITRGSIKSCGCQKGRKPIHGLRHNKFYQTWSNMIDRCTNTLNKQYTEYGARGIVVCEEWLDITNFVAWCELTHPNIEGFTLDRIDNDKGYSPNNCRWADRVTQNTNQRMKSTNTSGFVGVVFQSCCPTKPWKSSISVNKEAIHLGSFKTKEEAVLIRDNYIIENNLPHRLSTDYIKDTK